MFWFLVIIAGLNFLSFLFLFKDTFRRERSSTYQTVLKRRTAERALKSDNGSQLTVTNAADGLEAPPLKVIKLSLRDVNPFPPIWLILRRKNNVAILFSSCLLFAFSFSITYTCARTLANKYGYDPLTTGLVLLSFGIGNILGSVLGGRW